MSRQPIHDPITVASAGVMLVLLVILGGVVLIGRAG
jgi:hypothetical protein